jgi:glycosyltransferase involved in cell wall biosynthesis
MTGPSAPRPANAGQPQVPEASTPRLTIGMPAYNSARTIRRAIESLLAQTYPHFQLIVSDDCSKDDTAEVSDEYAAHDSRVVVVRQPRNLNYGNFRFLLQSARTPLFMFAPADDWWHPNYARRMIEALDANPGAVCAVSRVAFMRGDVFVREAGGTGALTADPATNIARFIAGPNDNSRMCGVLRTEVAQRAFPERNFHAFDWATSVGTLREGTHIEVPEILLWRDYTDPARYVEYIPRDAPRLRDRVFPLWPLTRDIVGRLRVPMTRPVLNALVARNLAFHTLYMRRYHPKIAAASGVIGDAGSLVFRAGRWVTRRVVRLVA